MMTRIFAGASLIFFNCGWVSAQAPATRPEFEVASVKPSKPAIDGRPRNGGMMRMGMGHVEASKVPMSQFADMLSNILARPVVDTTEIKGVFDFTLDYTPDENTPGMNMRMGMIAAGPRPEGGGGE